MICPKNNFIFLHIPKTAGRSVRTALRPDCYTFSQELSRLLDPFKQKCGLQVSPWPKSRSSSLRGHPTAVEYLGQMGKVFRSYFVFAFVRDPYDWLVSYYEWARRDSGTDLYERFSRMSFEQYIDWATNGGMKTQKSYIVDHEGALVIDYVGRFERLSEDFAAICEQIGIRNRLPHKNKSSRRSFSGYFSAETDRKVRNYFAEDFEYFEYK